MKAVYDQAFAKVVTDPANAVMPIIPMAASLSQDLIQVGDFLQSIGTQARFDNQSIQLQTQQQVNQYNQLMTSIAAKHQELLNAKNRSAAIFQN